MKKSGKTNVRVTHVPQISPSYVHKLSCMLPFLWHPNVPLHVVSMVPLIRTPFHHYMIYHLLLNDVHGHAIPFRG